MTDKKKYPCWVLSGDCLPDDATEWIIPCEPLPEYKDIGGGMSHLLGFLETNLDEIIDGDEILIKIKFLTKDEVEEIPIYD